MSDHEWSDSDRESPPPNTGTGQKRPRHTTGCHTCRVRRKRCDEQFGPDGCDTCRRLHIECIPSFGHRRRPEWLRDPHVRDNMRSRLKEFLKSSVRPGIVTPDVKDGVPFLYLNPESIERQRLMRASMHRHSSSSYGHGSDMGGQHHRTHAGELTQPINLPQLLPNSPMAARSQTPQPIHGHAARITHLNARSQTPQSFHGPTTQSSSWNLAQQNWGAQQQGMVYGDALMTGATAPYDFSAAGLPMNFATSGYSGDMFLPSNNGPGNSGHMPTQMAAYSTLQQNADSFYHAAGMVRPDIWDQSALPVSLDPTMINFNPYPYSEVNPSQTQQEQYQPQYNAGAPFQSQPSFDPTTSPYHAHPYR